ncbi:MAG: hypothetical protein J6R26_09050 [Paludibacteraceae bacterium]|nr:hypothetical protein [Paludibacteraceae bacterium]
MKKFTLLLSAMLFSMMSFAAVVTFDADTDKGNAGTDSSNAAAYSITKDGVTVTVSSGILGTYNNEMHYRIYKNQTLTVTSTVGNITSVEFTCTAKDDEKYGPGCFTWSTGDYTYSNAVGTWSGSASEVVFTASSNQVRTTQVVVTIDGEGGGSDDNTGSGDNDTPVTGTEITNLKYADAIYVADVEYGDYWVFDLYNDYDYEAYDYIYPELYVMVNEAYSKTAINGTYNVLYSEYMPTADNAIITDENAEDFVGTLTIKNVDNEGNYSFKGSFTATDGQTYIFDQTVEVFAYSYVEEDGVPVYEELTLTEEGGNDNPGGDDNQGDDDDPVIPSTPSGEVTFDADVDKGNASLDAANQTPYSVSKDGVTLEVTKGMIGTYNNENHYRIYKNETLTITSTVGTIVGVEFTCTANDDAKYGPGCLTWSTGDYTYSGAVGTWTGSATSVEFVASTNQVRATQIVVKLATATGVEDVTIVEVPVKVFQNGQLMIIRGENQYNAAGVQVK